MAVFQADTDRRAGNCRWRLQHSGQIQTERPTNWTGTGELSRTDAAGYHGSRADGSLAVSGQSGLTAQQHRGTYSARRSQLLSDLAGFAASASTGWLASSPAHGDGLDGREHGLDRQLHFLLSTQRAPHPPARRRRTLLAACPAEDDQAGQVTEPQPRYDETLRVSQISVLLFWLAWRGFALGGFALGGFASRRVCSGRVCSGRVCLGLLALGGFAQGGFALGGIARRRVCLEVGFPIRGLAGRGRQEGGSRSEQERGATPGLHRVTSV